MRMAAILMSQAGHGGARRPDWRGPGQDRVTKLSINVFIAGLARHTTSCHGQVVLTSRRRQERYNDNTKFLKQHRGSEATKAFFWFPPLVAHGMHHLLWQRDKVDKVPRPFLNTQEDLHELSQLSSKFSPDGT